MSDEMKTAPSALTIEAQTLRDIREAVKTGRWLLGTLSMAGQLSASPNIVEKLDEAIAKIDAALSKQA